MLMKTKSIRLTEDEAKELAEFVAGTGIVEAAALKQAALRGLREVRLDYAVLDYLQYHDLAKSATLVGLPRAELLQAMADRGIPVLEGPSTLGSELGAISELLDSNRLRRLVRSRERVSA